jgi:hypothetical protein
MLRASSPRERLEQVRVLPASAVVVAGRGGSDSDQVDVDVEAVTRSDHVAKYPPVRVDAIGRRFGDETDGGSGRQ